MTKEEYKAQRDELMKVANESISSGDLETARKTRTQVESLDNKFEEEAKEAANLAALEKKEIVDIMDKNQPVKGEVIDRTITPKISDEAAYRNVFAKSLQGVKLTEEDNRIFNLFNPQNTTQGTSSHTAVVPTTLMEEVFTDIGTGHPILNAVQMTKVTGNVTYPFETASGNASWSGETDAISDSTDTTGSLELKGYPLTKLIPVSWTLKKMSTEAFLLYLRKNLADKLGAALAQAVAQGHGVPGNGDTFKAQPKGISTALEAESSTPQVVTWTASTDEPDYDMIAGLMAKLGSGYVAGAAFYATQSFIWNKLALIKDTTGRPIFMPDASLGGVGRIFGLPVYVEDGIPANALILGDVANGYRMNVSEDLTIYEEDEITKQRTNYLGYMLADGAPITTKAFVYLKKSA